MASPQPKYFTRVSNELAEAFCRFRISGEAWQVLWAILRMTYGYRRKEAVITLDDFVRFSRLEKRQTLRALAWLKSRNVIRRDKKNVTALNKDYETWELSTKDVDNLKSEVTKNGSKGDKKRFFEVTKNGHPLYRKKIGKENLKISGTLDVSGDKSEGRRKIEIARALLAERMTM